MFIPLIAAAVAVAMSLIMVSSFRNLRHFRRFIYEDEKQKRAYIFIFPFALLYFVPVVISAAAFSIATQDNARLMAVVALSSNLFYLPGLVHSSNAMLHFDVNLDRQQSVRKSFSNIRFAGMVGIIITLILPCILMFGAMGVTAGVD